MSGDGGGSDGGSDGQRDDTCKEFKDAVNMTPRALKDWLATDESKSVGHASGRRIIELLEKKKADLTDSDIAHMRKVVGYVHRHLKQRPSGDVTETRWRYSLMNWGHDPVA
ncbi:DUF3140 domain-containing protein [Streptomyces sp. NPDC020607]|uniref:DUF3140 domain-containing protein n=1 Tax=Streptomyces sp. NPDC020607 TaxID=3365082 RepID=UPI0037AD9F0B